MKTDELHIELRFGDKVTDIVTGFTGIVIGLAQHQYCTDQARIQPNDCDGTFIQAVWIDQTRLEVEDRINA